MSPWEVLRRAQTRAVRRTISQNNGSIVSPGGIKCHVVQMHKRVGTQITSTCNDTANVQSRLVKAKHAFGALATRCFATPELDVGTKVDFFRCLIASILLYGVETWTRPSWASLRDVQHVCHGIPATHHSMSLVCLSQEKTQSVMKSSASDCSFPSFACLRVRNRITCPLSLVHQPFVPLAAILRSLDEPSNHWCNVLCDDLRKLAAHNPSELGHVGAPERDPVPWHAFMLNERGVFLRLLRGVTSRVSGSTQVCP